MKEKKKKTRIFWDPFEVSDYISRERWLEARAAKGWKLVSYTGKFPRFEKTTPFQARYRLDYHHDRNMDDEQVELYEAAGWEYVDTLGEQFYIFVTKDPHAEELHTDPEMQAYAMRKLLRDHILGLVLATVVSVLYAIWMIHAINKQNTPVAELVRTGPGPILYAIATFGFLFYVQIAQAIRFIKIWRQLRRGEHRPKEKSYRKAAFSDGLGWIVALVACFSWLIVDAMDPRIRINNVADYPEPLPFLQLHEIEQKDNFEYDSSIYNGTDWANYIESSSTPFAQQIMEAKQYGASTPTENGRDSYLYTTYFHTAHEKLASRILYELMQGVKDDFAYEWSEPTLFGIHEAYYATNGEKTEDDLESASGDLYFRDKTYQFLFLRLDNQVIKICYQGTQDLLAFADEYIALLQAQ
ncbi:MAG: DUF2812 domain-containing protein [Ruminococcaceae bacterium]|nr:DUF2812 domain-containing protein [Oscillospiraceae bacterium]